jgi:uncharacterized membrane protein (UPF0127 family)
VTTEAAKPAEDRRLRWLLWAAVALIGLGLWAFVLRGADEPADPKVGGLASALDPPGDPARVPLDGFGELAITVDPGDGSGLLSWCLLAALTAEQRSHGLMGVTDLQGYSGMAFVYPEDSRNSYYMRGTPMPLSIAWIDGDGGLVSTADMAPCEDREGCPVYPPGGAYRLAIEVPQGGLGALGIVPGSDTTVSGDCAPSASAQG